LSTDPLEVSTFSTVVLGVDDLFLLVGLYSHKHLVVLWCYDLNPYWQSDDRALQQSSFQEERLSWCGENRLSIVRASIAEWLLGILNANRKIRKRTDTDVAFTLEYSRVSIFHRERECTN